MMSRYTARFCRVVFLACALATIGTGCSDQGAGEGGADTSVAQDTGTSDVTTDLDSASAADTGATSDVKSVDDTGAGAVDSGEKAEDSGSKPIDAGEKADVAGGVDPALCSGAAVRKVDGAEPPWCRKGA